MSSKNNYNPNMGRRRSALKSLKRKDTVGIILLGDEKVGKSAIIRRWMNSEFTDVYHPTVEDFFMKTVISLHRRVNTGVVDIAGSRQFPTMDDLYILKSDVIVLTYEIGNEKSIKALQRYYENSRTILNDKKVIYVVVGTKYDLHESDDESPSEVGQAYFTDLPQQPMQFLTCARTGHNVNGLFEYAIREAIKRSKSPGTQSNEEPDLDVEEEEKTIKHCCSIV